MGATDGSAPSSEPATLAFRKRLRGYEPVVGAFVNLGSAIVTEVMGTGGFDWLVIDLEHGAGDEAALLAQLQALNGSGATALVRVEAVDLPRFMHALDLGADGVLVPRLRTVDDARRSVEYCRYAGERGLARSSRSWRWGRASRLPADVDAAVICALQIETTEALECVDEIAGLDGVDVLFVGPVDLARAFGLDCGPDDPRLLAKAAVVARAAKAHGKAAGMLVGTPEQARAYSELGFTFLGCGSDGGMLATGANKTAEALRDLAGGATAIPGEGSKSSTTS